MPYLIYSAKKSSLIFATIAIGFFYSNAAAQSSTSEKSIWVHPDFKGILTYKPLQSGDQIMDFSYAGYMGGGVKIPSVPVMMTVNPVEGDNSDVIQNAIDRVSQMPVENGFRGAVLLHPGIYNCNKSIIINASGVVLRGSGSGENGTVINMTGKPHICISVRGRQVTTTVGDPAYFSDAYVPSGANTFNLNDASGFSVGDTIRITRPVTDSWVHL